MQNFSNFQEILGQIWEFLGQSLEIVEMFYGNFLRVWNLVKKIH